eukprot:10442513-Ditylum_brightwellii.AAC.1
MEMDDPIAFATKHDSNNMYFHQAVKQPNAPHFVDAIVKEIKGLIKRGHWELIPEEEVPKGTKILDAVWAMKQVRDIKTRKMANCKVMLNVHSGQQQYGMNNFETYEL